LSTNYELGIKIKTTSDDAALKQSEQELKKIGTTAKESGEKAAEGEGGFSKLKTAIKGMLVAAAGYMALGKLKQFMSEAFRAAINGEYALLKLKVSLKELTGASDKSAKGIADWILNVDRATGIAKEKLIPAYQALLGASGSAAAAQAALTIAVSADIKGMGQMSTVANSLSMVLAGMSPVGRDAFNNMLRIKIHTLGAAGAMKYLTEKYSDLGQAMESNRIEVDKTTHAWENTEEAIGGGFTSSVVALQPLLKAASYAVTGMATGVMWLTDLAWAGAKAIKALGLAFWKLAHKDFADAKAAIEAGGMSMSKTMDEAAAAVDKAWAGTFAAWGLKAKVHAQSAGEALKSLLAAIEHNKKAGSKADKDAADSAVDLKKAIDDLTKARNAEAKATAKANIQNAKTADDAIVASMNYQAIIDEEHDKAVDAIDEEYAKRLQTTKDADKLNKWYNAKMELEDLKYSKKSLALKKKTALKVKQIDDKALSDHAKDLKKRGELDDKYRKKYAKAMKNLHNSEMAVYMDIMGMLSEYGGKTAQKIVAIANTAMEVVQLVKDVETMYSAWKAANDAKDLMASTAASKAEGVTGITDASIEWATNAAASVAAIPVIGWAMAPEVYAAALNQGMSGLTLLAAARGADIPAGINPIVQAHAQEMILPKEYADVIRGLAGQSSNNYTNNHRQTTNINITTMGGYFGKAQLRELTKLQRPAGRSINRQHLGRTARTIGSVRQ